MIRDQTARSLPPPPASPKRRPLTFFRRAKYLVHSDLPQKRSLGAHRELLPFCRSRPAAHGGCGDSQGRCNTPISDQANKRGSYLTVRQSTSGDWNRPHWCARCFASSCHRDLAKSERGSSCRTKRAKELRRWSPPKAEFDSSRRLPVSTGGYSC